MFYQQIMKLCMENNISLTTLVTKELGMSVSNVTKWKNGNTPKIDTVQRIATYFNVSTDYLLGNEQKNKPITSKEDDELINLFEQIPTDKKQEAVNYLRYLIEHREK